MEIKRLGPIGAEIKDLDLTNFNEQESNQIKNSFLEYSVLVFRNQMLNPEQLKSISTLWGCLLYTSPSPRD